MSAGLAQAATARFTCCLRVR